MTVDFSTADGGETHLVWLWEPETRYVFQPDQSYDTIGGDEDPVAAYVGLWEYQDENLWLRIHEDASWEFVNSADEVLYDGVVLADSSGWSSTSTATGIPCAWTLPPTGPCWTT